MMPQSRYIRTRLCSGGNRDSQLNRCVSLYTNKIKMLEVLHSMIKIPRSLNVHRCCKCRCSIADMDFLRIGITVFPDLRWFFDYRCPICSHLGRYVISVPADCKPTQALQALAKLVRNRKLTRYSADWDTAFW